MINDQPNYFETRPGMKFLTLVLFTAVMAIPLYILFFWGIGFGQENPVVTFLIAMLGPSGILTWEYLPWRWRWIQRPRDQAE